MAKRRGINDVERLALDFITITADAALVSAPCFVYKLIVSPLDTNVTGLASIADTTAAADAVKESAKIEVKTMAGGLSAAGANVQLNFMPPLYVATSLYGDSTNTRITAVYLPAS